MPDKLWRTGSKVPINVYEGDRPVCQCQTADDASRIVAAMNGTRVFELEDAITEAGIILSASEHSGTPYGDIKRAMDRLDGVMNDPAILKRQGI